MKTLRELYGVGIIFFYFLKWPVLIGLPLMYTQLNYQNNPILNILWLLCLVLILQDFIGLFRKKKPEKGSNDSEDL